MISEAKLKQIYTTMLQCRMIAERRDASRRRGSTAPQPVSAAGREAIAVAAAIDLRREDWLGLTPADSLGRFVKGVSPAKLFAPEPKQRRSTRAAIGSEDRTQSKDEDATLLHLIPSVEDPVQQINLAAGIALANRATKSDSVVMVFSPRVPRREQAWQEALTFAASHCLPLLIVVEVKPSGRQSAADKQQAPFPNQMSDSHACGLPAIAVDADDAVAIYRVAYECIHKARHGGGPTLIEARRFPEAGRARAKTPDAITKMEAYLTAKGLFSPSWKQRVIDRFDREMDAALLRR